ncbi:MAG TPA: PIN domain-containing protein [Phaeodactylibacter sp.]|nr:PIN domain-containing protein [Phaeodactylibacter sp.]
MKQVFLDTDVIMDFLIMRQPFAVESMKLMEYSNRNTLKLYISSLSLSNIYYLISRIENKSKSREKIKGILKLVETLSVHKSTIEKAVYSEFKDFEDAIQNFCAKENGIKSIITRNTKDYSKSSLSIQTPKEFIIEFEKKYIIGQPTLHIS